MSYGVKTRLETINEENRGKWGLVEGLGIRGIIG